MGRQLTFYTQSSSGLRSLICMSKEAARSVSDDVSSEISMRSQQVGINHESLELGRRKTNVFNSSQSKKSA